MTLTVPVAPTAPISYTMRHWTGCARQEAARQYECEQAPPTWDWFFLLPQCVYERQWQQLAEHRAQVKLIVLYAWNLYGEQAYIEPATVSPPRPSIGDRYVARTQAYCAALPAGRPIVPASHCAYLPEVLR